MNNTNANKIVDILDSKLNQFRAEIKEDIRLTIEPVNKKLDALWDQTVKLTEGLEEVKETLKSQIVSTSETNTSIGNINTRLAEVEGHLGIIPPPELSATQQ